MPGASKRQMLFVSEVIFKKSFWDHLSVQVMVDYWSVWTGV